MLSVPFRRARPPLALSLPFLFAVAASSAAVAGDVDDATRFSRLELSGTGLGQPLAVDLRTANPGGPALLMLSAQITPFNPDGPAGIPWLRTFGPLSGFIVIPTDAAGMKRPSISCGKVSQILLNPALLPRYMLNCHAVPILASDGRSSRPNG